MHSWWDLINSHWSIVCLIVLTIAYYLLTQNFEFFAQRDVPHVKPIIMFGNSIKVFARLESTAELIQRLYQAFPDCSFFGVFDYQTPVFVIRDPDLIEQMSVKYFDYFDVCHPEQRICASDPVLRRCLIALKISKKYCETRSLLSSTFSGSKMRLMYKLVDDCSGRAVMHLEHRSHSDHLELEMKAFFSHFVSNVIWSSAFGIDVNTNKPEDNEFFVMGNAISNCARLSGWKSLAFSTCASLMKLLRVPQVDRNAVDFCRYLVATTVTERQNGADGLEDRSDMVNLLLEAQRTQDQEEEDTGASTNDHMNDDDITAHCITFFLAGYETASQLMCFMAHELAINPDVQNRLRQEVDTVRADLDGEPLTFEIIQRMEYMDMVVRETLRKWPPIRAIERACVKPFILQNLDGVRVEVEAGDRLQIPLYALHRDPNYFPDPERFDPERFADKNKSLVQPFTYMPFGFAPRNCIGYRLALMQTIAVFFHILSSFVIEPSPRALGSRGMAALNSGSINARPTASKGFWVKLKARKYSKAGNQSSSNTLTQ